MIKSWDRLVVRFAFPNKVIRSIHLNCEFLWSLLKMDFEQTLFKIHFKRSVRFLNTLKVQLGHRLRDGPRGHRVFRVLGRQTPSPGNPTGGDEPLSLQASTIWRYLAFFLSWASSIRSSQGTVSSSCTTCFVESDVQTRSGLSDVLVNCWNTWQYFIVRNSVSVLLKPQHTSACLRMKNYEDNKRFKIGVLYQDAQHPSV